MIFVFLLASLCITGSSFIYLTRTDSNLFFFMAEQYSIVYMYHILFILSSVDGHTDCFQCPSYCKQCCYKHWGTCVFFSYGFLRVYAQQWDCWAIWQCYSQFFKESPYCSPQWLYQFTFLATVQEGSLFFTPSPAFIVCRFFDDGHSDLYEYSSLYLLIPFQNFRILEFM